MSLAKGKNIRDGPLNYLQEAVYKDVRSILKVGDGFSEELGVVVSVHQGSVLSRLNHCVRGSI